MKFNHLTAACLITVLFLFLFFCIISTGIGIKLTQQQIVPPQGSKVLSISDSESGWKVIKSPSGDIFYSPHKPAAYLVSSNPSLPQNSTASSAGSTGTSANDLAYIEKLRSETELNKAKAKKDMERLALIRKEIDTMTSGGNVDAHNRLRSVISQSEPVSTAKVSTSNSEPVNNTKGKTSNSVVNPAVANKFCYVGGSVPSVSYDKECNPVSTDVKREKIAAVMASFNTPGNTIDYPAHGEEKDILYVFQDYKCPSCQKFHKNTIPKLQQNGVTVKMLFFPLTGIQPENPVAMERAGQMLSAWCSKEPTASLDLLYSGLRLPEPDCSDLSEDKKKINGNPVALHSYMGDVLEFNSTPTLVTRDGRYSAGHKTLYNTLKFMNGQ